MIYSLEFHSENRWFHVFILMFFSWIFEHLYPLLISTVFLKNPLELKKKFRKNGKKISVSLELNLLPSLKWMPKWIFQKISGDQQGVRLKTHKSHCEIRRALMTLQLPFCLCVFLQLVAEKKTPKTGQLWRHFRPFLFCDYAPFRKIGKSFFMHQNYKKTPQIG